MPAVVVHSAKLARAFVAHGVVKKRWLIELRLGFYAYQKRGCVSVHFGGRPCLGLVRAGILKRHKDGVAFVSLEPLRASHSSLICPQSRVVYTLLFRADKGNGCP